MAPPAPSSAEPSAPLSRRTLFVGLAKLGACVGLPSAAVGLLYARESRTSTALPADAVGAGPVPEGVRFGIDHRFLQGEGRSYRIRGWIEGPGIPSARAARLQILLVAPGTGAARLLQTRMPLGAPLPGEPGENHSAPARTFEAAVRRRRTTDRGFTRIYLRFEREGTVHTFDTGLALQDHG
jgi:hypothetical protein